MSQKVESNHGTEGKMRLSLGNCDVCRPPKGQLPTMNPFGFEALGMFS